DGTIPETEHKRLSELEQGQSAIIRRVSDRDPSVLKYLARLGLFPGALIKILDVGPLGDTLIISAGKNEHAFGKELSRRIKVEVCSENGLPAEELEGLAAWQSRELLSDFRCWPWSRRKVGLSKPQLQAIQQGGDR
ncbi:MAG: ferrous iron transport protein A, partial [Armatimonadetes bacterium]|nr:ferrous iron transport protein A [Armatimonadota bacterium]